MSSTASMTTFMPKLRSMESRTTEHFSMIPERKIEFDIAVDYLTSEECVDTMIFKYQKNCDYVNVALYECLGDDVSKFNYYAKYLKIETTTDLGCGFSRDKDIETPDVLLANNQLKVKLKPNTPYSITGIQVKIKWSPVR
jgi:hypothetical protein